MSLSKKMHEEQSCDRFASARNDRFRVLSIDILNRPSAFASTMSSHPFIIIDYSLLDISTFYHAQMFHFIKLNIAKHPANSSWVNSELQKFQIFL